MVDLQITQDLEVTFCFLERRWFAGKQTLPLLSWTAECSASQTHPLATQNFEVIRTSQFRKVINHVESWLNHSQWGNNSALQLAEACWVCSFLNHKNAKSQKEERRWVKTRGPRMKVKAIVYACAGRRRSGQVSSEPWRWVQENLKTRPWAWQHLN